MDLYRDYFNLSPPLINYIQEAEERVLFSFQEIALKALHNQKKVLEAFKEFRVSEFNFFGSTGYGYGDTGRDTLEKIYARIFGVEDALVRLQFVSGTHALAVCLFALLEAGDILLSAAGTPYSTLQRVIGIENDRKRGTLRDKGVRYKEVPLNSRGKIDFATLEKELKKGAKIVFLQRSRGYSWRPAVTLEEMKKVSNLIKRVSPGTIFFVDNCYGEFVDIKEPPEMGADLLAGSLIKNPGGGLAPLGGYAAGKKELIERVGDELTAPGLGKEVGASLNINRSYYQGLFLAPHTVGEALKGALLASSLFGKMGFEVSPLFDETRSDIVQAIKFGDPELLLSFCRGIQSQGPVDSYVVPEPGWIPGYGEKVVMAAGTFYQGASLELSADAPFEEPYIAYLQGGLTYEHGKIGIIHGAKEVFELLHRIKNNVEKKDDWKGEEM